MEMQQVCWRRSIFRGSFIENRAKATEVLLGTLFELCLIEFRSENGFVLAVRDVLRNISNNWYRKSIRS